MQDICIKVYDKVMNTDKYTFSPGNALQKGSMVIAMHTLDLWPTEMSHRVIYRDIN
jgi:hypothetical protein